MTALQRSATPETPLSGVEVTAGTTANDMTGASWEQLIGSTNAVSSGIILIFQLGGTTDYENENFLVDIGIGAAGFETVLIPKLAFYTGSGIDLSHATYQFPLVIPASSRISARCQCTTASAYLRANALISFDPWGFTSGDTIDAIGVNTADSGGAGIEDVNVVDPTEGAWKVIDGNLTSSIDGFLPALIQTNPTLQLTERENLVLDIGVGESGSEVELISDLPFSTNQGEFILPGQWPYLPVPIDAGSRVVARTRASVSLLTNNLDLILYGLRTA